MSDTHQRWPLEWPGNWPRTRERRRADFTQTKTDERETATEGGATRTVRVKRSVPVSVIGATGRLEAQLARLGARLPVLSTNVELRLDGRPRSDRSDPGDPGAAVYFTLHGAARCLACDRWDRVADNIAALAAHIDALRRIDRYGVGTLDQAFRGYTALQPATTEWWLVLEVSRQATIAQVEASFTRLAKIHHPDKPGGSHSAMSRLTEARELARVERGELVGVD
jgi:hypothetical protein